MSNGEGSSRLLQRSRPAGVAAYSVNMQTCFSGRTVGVRPAGRAAAHHRSHASWGIDGGRCGARRQLPHRPAAVWDESMALSDLKVQLDAALKVENYQLAARIRDAIQCVPRQRSVDMRLAVEDANTRFYDAFRSGNIKEMEAIWGQGDHVQCIHPESEAIATREAVLDSWRSVLAGVRPRALRLDLEDVRIWASDSMGYVTCVEVIDADDSMGRIVATNVFEKQDGKWVITLHHGGPVPPRRRPRPSPSGSRV